MPTRIVLPLLLLATLCPQGARASLIVDRAPEANAIAQIFITASGIRTEWELKAGVTQPRLVIRPNHPRKPTRVTISPPGGTSATRIGFVVYHLGLPVADLHYLTRPETLRLDWADPWRSKFTNPRLRRLYDSPLGVFLYVEPYEVRVEIVGRPPDLGVRSPTNLGPQITRALAGRWRLEIDGRPVTPVLDRVQFLERRLRTSSVVAPPPVAELSYATLGAVYRVDRDRLPREATLTWNLFPADSGRAAGSVSDASATRPALLRPGSNRLRWENIGQISTPSLARVPAPPPAWARFAPFIGWTAAAALLALGLLLAGRARAGRPLPRAGLLAAFLLLAVSAGAFSKSRSTALSAGEAKPIVRALLYNVYRAFDHHREDAVYDTLARSVNGDLLRKVYLEARRSLEVASLGGARTRVREVTVESADPDSAAPGSPLTLHCVWTVTGTVGHWGHTHIRHNRYDADLEIAPVDGVWKLTGLSLRDEERLPAPITRP